MNDECGVENITGGSSFDYSCDTQTSNEHSSVNDCTTNVQTNNDYSDLGNPFLSVENTTELISNVESTKSVLNGLKTPSNENSPTKLQDNKITTKDEFLKSQSIQDVPPSSNYIRRADRMGNNHSNYSLSNANRIPIKEERWKNYPRIQAEQNNFRRTFFYMFIGTIVIAFLFILMVYVVIFANYPTKLAKYKPLEIKPLPQGA